jgi:hypothetical protein
VIEKRNWVMARYIFTLCSEVERSWPEHRVELKDDAAALAYACDLARDLVRTGKSADPAWRVIVVHEKRGIVLTVPLFAACA